MRRWRFVKYVIRTYPELEAARPLEPEDNRQFEAVDRAVRWTEKLPSGPRRMKIVELLYWRERPCSLRKAAQTVGYSYQHAAFVHRQFLYMVAANLEGEAIA
ncbi:MAG: hypothetical protein LUG44_06940 [Clostridiales bacterium]|nr:hypothetical protein [Clostridiales bacterium]